MQTSHQKILKSIAAKFFPSFVFLYSISIIISFIVQMFDISFNISYLPLKEITDYLLHAAVFGKSDLLVYLWKYASSFLNQNQRCDAYNHFRMHPLNQCQEFWWCANTHSNIQRIMWGLNRLICLWYQSFWQQHLPEIKPLRPGFTHFLHI